MTGTRIKPEDKLTLSDHQLIWRWRNNKALSRKRRIHPNLTAKLERLIPQLEAEAERRGIATYLTGWRPYPSADGALTFGHRFDGDGLTVDHVPPVTAKRRRRRRHESQSPSPADGGAMLTDLERALAESIERARSNTNRTPAKKASEPLTLTDGCNTLSIQSTNAGEPAEGNTMSPTTTKAHPLIRKHDELVAKYNSSTGALKAVASRQIAECELDLTLAGVEGWTPWEKPTTVRSHYELTPEGLLAEIGKLRQLLGRGDVSEVITAAADRRLTRYVEQAQRRGIEVPES